MSAADSLLPLVDLCWTDGHLWGARPGTASRTLTVRGKRRHRMRLQSDICAAIMAPQDVSPYYPDLWLDVLDRVHELREAMSPQEATGRDD